MKNCMVCGKELLTSLDEYGDVNQEVCQSCWLERGDVDPDMPESWYGLGPHKHAFDTNGNIIIGGTTFEPLSEYPKTDSGEYIIGNLLFMPDSEEPGCGIWSRR